MNQVDSPFRCDFSDVLSNLEGLLKTQTGISSALMADLELESRDRQLLEYVPRATLLYS